MTERSERFRSRRARLDSQTGNTTPPIADAKLVGGTLSQEIDWTLIDSVALKVPVFNHEVTEEEVTRCLSDLDKVFTPQKYDALFDGIRDTLIDQLLGPVGLSRSDLKEVDREFFGYGGEEGVKEHYGKGFDATRKGYRKDKMKPDGTITDEYTGQSHHLYEMDLDHIISKKELHDKGGFMLEPDERAELGNDPDNLAITHQSINRSKGSGRLEDQPNTDKRRTKPAQARAEKAVKSHIRRGVVVGRAAKDGVKVGTRQGLQQALPLLVSELISAVLSEVWDVFERGWKGGNYNLSWLEILKRRLKRVMHHLLARWQDVAAAFGTGWLSGFLSAIMTALLNMFVRTGQSVVRIIREGFLSIMRAINVLLHPPEGMSLREAAHEASKAFTAGLVVTGGILAGEAIAKSLSAMPLGFGDVLASVLGGLISGLGSLFVVFMLDKLDLFGVAFDERHTFIMGALEDRISTATRKIEGIAVDSGLIGSGRLPAEPSAL